MPCQPSHPGSRNLRRAEARARLGRRLRAAMLPLAAALQLCGAAALADEPIAPLLPVAAADDARVRLGEMLFRDTRLSRGNAVACASCHRLDAGGDDGVARATGLDGRLLDFNTPTVFNVAGNFRFNWRGNFRALERQAEAALLDNRLMGASWPSLITRLAGDPTYERAFGRAYGQGPARPLVLDALAAFQRSLATPGAPFDRYLRGDRRAITPAAERGYQLFKSYGCAACHQGANVGGNLFQRFGIFRNPFGARPPSKADLGRFAITGEERDRHVFRVPSLRNVAVTAPYFHDGRAATLEQAIEEMAASQLGRELSAADIDLIAGFLRSLTGTYKGKPLGDAAGVPP